MRQLIDVPNEGLESLLGQVITLLCGNYFYTGKLVGVNDTFVKLDDPAIVYETGSWDKPGWQTAQKLPHSVYVMLHAVECFGVMK